eukprot:TRINITY_DN728_c0_g1_i6.p1 TRINITY_DN728_c0_g1~~TRINITY_DN728_c0_g1_i6.p1  ORF type:complete len:895 (+),score=364.58 TRINITY_DN728_c0_g1_i6:81-2687(+)
MDTHFDFGDGPTPAISFLARFQDQNLVLSTSNVALSRVIPQMADSGLGTVAVFFSTYEFTDSISNRVIKKGLNVFADNFQWSPGAMNGALDALSTNGWTLTGSLQGVYSPDINQLQLIFTNPTLPITSTVTLVQNKFDVRWALLPLPSHFELLLASTLQVQFPRTRAWSVPMTADYSSTNSRFILTGTIPRWDSPFDLPWLSIEPSTLSAVFDRTNGQVARAISIRSTATVSTANAQASVGLCGVFGEGLAMSLTDISPRDIAGLLCDLMGACTSSSVLDSLKLPPTLTIGITLATQDIQDWFWMSPANNLCKRSGNAPPAGLSIFSNFDLRGLMYDKFINQFLSKDMVDAIKNWQLSFNIPFVLSDGSSPASVAPHLMSKYRTSGVIDSITKFNINFQTSSLDIKLISWLTIIGVGVKAQPYPTPVFSGWMRARLTLQSNPAPLYIYVEGAVGVGTVTLKGVLTSEKWVDPFGIKGLVVYGAAFQIGFSAATIIDSFGLGFKAKFGPTLTISFAGLVSVSNLGSSYLRGSLESTRALTLRDVAQAITTMSNGALNIPDASLPGPDVLSLTSASFSVASSSGTDFFGQPYPAGLSFSANATIFSAIFYIRAGTTLKTVLGLPVTDFVLDFTVDLSSFNRRAVEWIRNIKVFDIGSWIADHRSLCDIICVNSLSVQGFSIIDMFSGRFPSVAADISVIGRRFQLSSVTLSLDKFAWTVTQFLDTLRPSFNLPDCIVDSNCPTSAPVCDQASGWTCKSGCKSGCVHFITGCICNPFSTAPSPTPAASAPSALSHPEVAAFIESARSSFTTRSRTTTASYTVAFWEEQGVDIYNPVEFATAQLAYMSRVGAPASRMEVAAQQYLKYVVNRD